MLYAKQKDFERAIADYDKAASVAPKMLNPHYNKARALEQMDRAKRQRRSTAAPSEGRFIRQ